MVKRLILGGGGEIKMQSDFERLSFQDSYFNGQSKEQPSNSGPKSLKHSGKISFSVHGLSDRFTF